MPKLTRQFAQKATAAAEDWGDGFEPLEPGEYLAKLLSVEAKDGTAAPYWSWKLEEKDSGKFLWQNTSLSDKAIGGLGKMFEAFGQTADTDTDLLVGQWIACRVSQRAIAKGDRAGQMTNNIERVYPASEHPAYATLGQADSPDDFGLGDED